jgi:hypothetical protein
MFQRIFKNISSYRFIAGSLGTTEPHALYLKGNNFQSAFQSDNPIITAYPFLICDSELSLQP